MRGGGGSKPGGVAMCGGECVIMFWFMINGRGMSACLKVELRLGVESES